MSLPIDHTQEDLTSGSGSFSPTPPPVVSFTIGQTVMYGLHGRCTITSIEEKTINQQSLRFFRLEPKKHPSSKSKDTLILVPTQLAQEQGLRPLIAPEDTLPIFKVLSAEDTFFPMNKSWQITALTLEQCVKEEGAIGLAKGLTFLTELKRQVPSLPTDVNKFEANLFRILSREIADTLGQPIRSVEEKIKRTLAARPKMKHSH